MSGDEMVFGSEEAMAGRVELVGDVVVLTLQGEFDVASGPVFNEMVAAAEAPRPGSRPRASSAYFAAAGRRSARSS